MKNKTHPALGLEKVVTRDDALEAFDDIELALQLSHIYDDDECKWVKTIRQFLEQSLDGGWNFNMDECPKEDVIWGWFPKVNEVQECIYGELDNWYDGHAPVAWQYYNAPQPPKSEE